LPAYHDGWLRVSGRKKGWCYGVLPFEIIERAWESQEMGTDATRAQLERILASEGFAGADRISRFLRFVVESKLRGEEGQLKEYVIGREVFDRDENYDPRLDPIVRVEARRLRTKLDEYYVGPGLGDTVRISMPKGSYAPSVEEVKTAAAGTGRAWILAGVAAALVVLGGLALLSRDPAGERLAVAPAHWLGRDPTEPDALEDGLAEALTVELTRRGNWQVISWPSMLSYRGSRKRLHDVAGELQAALVLVVSTKRMGDDVRIVAHLVDGKADRKMWAGEYRRNAQDAAAAQSELARVIAEELEANRRAQK